MKTTKIEFERIFRKGGKRFPRAVLSPRLFWTAITSAVKLLPQEPLDRLIGYLFPATQPGGGVFRGRHNITKALTYRATGVPGGFNQARDARRAQHVAQVGSATWLSQYG